MAASWKCRAPPRTTHFHEASSTFSSTSDSPASAISSRGSTPLSRGVPERVLLATRSQHKAAEIRRILAHTGVELVTLSDAGIPESPDEDTIENEPTFLGNAIAKAQYFRDRAELPVISDDSGLEVRALDWGPGVRTRRFALDHGRTGLSGDALDLANNELLLQTMTSVSRPEREARYVCAAAIAWPNGSLMTAIGTCRGEIAHAPRGDGGFGYDPIFFIPDLAVTFAELTPLQKDDRSHRARAFRALTAVVP